jgi:hypothetical protein
MGLKTVWINRPEAIMGKPKDESIQPDWEFSSMEAFAHAMERAHGDLTSGVWAGVVRMNHERTVFGPERFLDEGLGG